MAILSYHHYLMTHLALSSIREPKVSAAWMGIKCLLMGPGEPGLGPHLEDAETQPCLGCLVWDLGMDFSNKGQCGS